MISVGIIEDDSNDRIHLKELLEKYRKEHNCIMEISCYSCGEEFFSKCTGRHDLIFMDMELGGINGIETSRKIREKDLDVTIVIVTSLIQYAVEGYSVKAEDYLLKPLAYDSFSEKLNAFLQTVRNKRKFIVVKTENGMKKLTISSISYLEVFGHQLFMVCQDRRERIFSTLKQMEEQLMPYGFVKCNKCYLVNLAYVEGIYGDDVEIAGTLLKISRREKTEFIQKLTRYAGI